MKQKLEDAVLSKKYLVGRDDSDQNAVIKEYINQLGITKKDIPNYVHFRSLEYDAPPCTSCDY